MKIMIMQTKTYTCYYTITYLIYMLIPDKNGVLVSGCDATHCSKAKALHTLLDCCAYNQN